MSQKPNHRRPKPVASDESADRGPGDRLQKVLAAAGLGSRRDCEELISQGRVEVDRKVVTELGTRADTLSQEIRVDGEALRQSKRLYFAVNKPVGVVTTNHDPSGRPRVIDLVPTEERVFAVGRLDRSSEGLILVTNDGEFANRLTHPRYGVEKTYLVRVAGAPDQRQLAKLKKGVHLAEGFARAQSIAVKKQHGQSTDLVIVLNEGRNREIRRILARIGHKVLALKRVAVGRVKLGDLPLGAWRRLMPDEIEGLLQVAKEKRREGKSDRPRRERPASESDKASTRSTNAGQPIAKRDSDDSQYVQKKSLLSQPLSLDDLLSDDLDEGPLTGSTSFGLDDGDAEAATKGGVIDYEDEFSSPPPSAPTKTVSQPSGRPRGKPGRGPGRARGEQRPGGHRHDKRDQGERHARGENRDRSDKREALESKPRENFGKKRGGKRLIGPREEGRGPAGEKAGNFRFRPKGKKQKPTAQGTDNQRRGSRRGGKQTQQGKQAGKHAGKRRGRR